MAEIPSCEIEMSRLLRGRKQHAILSDPFATWFALLYTCLHTFFPGKFSLAPIITLVWRGGLRLLSTAKGKGYHYFRRIKKSVLWLVILYGQMLAGQRWILWLEDFDSQTGSHSFLAVDRESIHGNQRGGGGAYVHEEKGKIRNAFRICPIQSKTTLTSIDFIGQRAWSSSWGLQIISATCS